MKPPFHLTPEILHAVGRIERLIGRIDGLEQPKPQPLLRKSNRVRTIQGSLAIESNTLDLDQVKQGCDENMLSKSGDKALTLYRFV